MFMEFTVFGHQTAAAAAQAKQGVDLMVITSYTRTPADNRVRIMGPGINNDVHMTQAEFDEFQTKLRTANRLKRGYE